MDDAEDQDNNAVNNAIDGLELVDIMEPNDNDNDSDNEERSPEQERIVEMERARMLLALNDIIVSISVNGEIRQNRMTNVDWRPLCDAVRGCFYTKSLLFPRHGEHTMHLLHFICQQNFPEAVIQEVIQRDPESVTSVSTPGNRRALHEACLNSPRNIRQLVTADPTSICIKDGNNLLPIEHYFGARIFDDLLPIHHPHVSHIELLLLLNNTNAEHNIHDENHAADFLHDIMYRRRSWFYLACKVWVELGNKEYDVSEEVVEDGWNIMLFVLRWLDHMEHEHGHGDEHGHCNADTTSRNATTATSTPISTTATATTTNSGITADNYLQDFCPMKAVMRSKQYMALVGICKGEMWEEFARRYRDTICTVDENGDTMLLKCVQLLGCEELQVSNTALLSRRKRAILGGFLDAKKESTVISNKKGELPLNVALQNGLTWEAGVDLMLNAAPRAIKTRNVATRLYPFMSAAIGEKSDLGTIFELLREHPKMSAGLAQSRSTKRTRCEEYNSVLKRSCIV